MNIEWKDTFSYVRPAEVTYEAVTVLITKDVQEIIDGDSIKYAYKSARLDYNQYVGYQADRVMANVDYIAMMTDVDLPN